MGKGVVFPWRRRYGYAAKPPASKDFLLAKGIGGKFFQGCAPPVRSEGATDDERALGPSPTCVVPVVCVREMKPQGQ